VKTYHPLPTIAEALAAPTLSDRVAFVRQARGLSMREVARQAGIAPSQVCKYESGEVRPGLDAFFEVAKALSVDPLVLYEGVVP
jgi:transcriptional regulator with XRE-family HTH domain